MHPIPELTLEQRIDARPASLLRELADLLTPAPAAAVPESAPVVMAAEPEPAPVVIPLLLAAFRMVVPSGTVISAPLILRVTVDALIRSFPPV